MNNAKETSPALTPDEGLVAGTQVFESLYRGG